MNRLGLLFVHLIFLLVISIKLVIHNVNIISNTDIVSTVIIVFKLIVVLIGENNNVVM